MATNSFFNSPTLPVAQPKRGSANPHLQATDQIMAQQLAAMSTNPQSTAQGQRYQDAVTGEQANMQAMQDLHGGWGEALARLGGGGALHGHEARRSAAHQHRLSGATAGRPLGRRRGPWHRGTLCRRSPARCRQWQWRRAADAVGRTAP